MAYESQRPGPVRHAEITISPGPAYFFVQLIGHKPTAQRHADQMLDQHIQGFMGRLSRFDPALRHRVLCRRGFDQLQAVRRHQRHPRNSPRCMPRTPRTLHQPRHAFGRANLQHPFHRQEIHTQIQAGGADHRFELTFLEGAFHPVTGFTGQRTVMQRDQPGPVRPGFKQGLIPDFRLRSSIGEHQAAGAGIQLRGDLRQHFQADMSGPWKAFDPGRQQRVDLQFFLSVGLER